MISNDSWPVFDDPFVEVMMSDRQFADRGGSRYRPPPQDVSTTRSCTETIEELVDEVTQLRQELDALKKEREEVWPYGIL